MNLSVKLLAKMESIGVKAPEAAYTLVLAGYMRMLRFDDAQRWV
jgi:hypothetical protein